MKITSSQNIQEENMLKDFDILNVIIKHFNSNNSLEENIQYTLKTVCHHTNACFAYYKPMTENHCIASDHMEFHIDTRYFSASEQEKIVRQVVNLSSADIIDESSIDTNETTYETCPNNSALHRILHRHKAGYHVTIPIIEAGNTTAIIEFFFHTQTMPNMALFECINQFLNATHKQLHKQSDLTNNVRRLENSQRISHIGSWEWTKPGDQCVWSDHVYELFGYKPNSFQSSVSALIEFAHFAERRQLRTFFDHIEDTPGKSIEYKALHLKGHEITIRIKASSIHQKGVITGIIQDISEQHQLNNMKADFISTVSHELRTPLTAIKGSLSLIEIDADNQENASNIHLMNIAQKNINRLLLLVNDILDMEKANSGELTLNLQDTDINQLVTDAANQMTHYASQFGTDIRLKLNSQAIFSNIDQNRISQAILNILSNAIKYSPECGTVTISTTLNSETLRILISDEGDGIPDDMRERVFEKFTQITTTPKNKIGGSGLGLSIAKILVEKHGGKIGIQSRRGKGTTFYIELNVIDSPIQRLFGSMPPTLKGNKTVLVIEDDIPTSKHLRILLQKLGYHVTNAYSVEQAREFVNNNSFSLITVDVMLPDQNGLTFVKELNNQDNNTPIFVISAVADIMKTREEHKSLKVSHWFTKPFNHHDFVRAVKSMSNNKSLEQAS